MAKDVQKETLPGCNCINTDEEAPEMTLSRKIFSF